MDIAWDHLAQLVNQLYNLEKKAARLEEKALSRDVQRMKRQFEQAGILYHAPLGEPYKETRTDCEATIVSEGAGDLRITEVIKPIIAVREGDFQQIKQRAVVLVEGNK